jgi:transposase-like protein
LKNTALTHEYAEKIRPLIPLATKAYGAKSQNTPAHVASRQYTDYLVEFTDKGGSLIDLSREVGVSYAGMRRRVFTANVPTMKTDTRRKLTAEECDEAVMRVRVAREQSTAKYHEQLAIEYYRNGVSLSIIAKGLGITNAAPLYYGVQRHVQRNSVPSSF